MTVKEKMYVVLRHFINKQIRHIWNLENKHFKRKKNERKTTLL